MEEQDLQKLFEDAQSKMSDRKLEALKDVFHSIPFGQEIPTSFGSAKLRSFFEPKVMPEDSDPHLAGIPAAGIDLVFEDGHVELILYVGGWGMSLGDYGPDHYKECMPKDEDNDS